MRTSNGSAYGWYNSPPLDLKDHRSKIGRGKGATHSTGSTSSPQAGSGQANLDENKIYFYHGDHLGSSNYITDRTGRVFEHTLYLPYGETWIDEGHEESLLGYKFTGKEEDAETKLIYFGARYVVHGGTHTAGHRRCLKAVYDPRVSNWISTDPALGEYLPTGKQTFFPEEAFDASKLKGAGGVYNSLNVNLYHYAGANPLKFVDPDGRADIESWTVRFIMNIMNAFAGNDDANRMATHQAGELGAALKNSPLSPSWYGLRIGAFIGAGAKAKFGSAEIDFSAKASADSDSNISVSLNIGPKTGGTKAGVFLTGTILKNGEFKPGASSNLGMNTQLKRDLKTLMRDPSFKDFEIGVAVGGGVGVEVYWKPGVLIENLLKKMNNG